MGLAAALAAPSGRGITSASAQSPASLAEPAAAQPRRHFDEGYRLSQQGDYEAAAREFATAYRLEPNASVLFNLGHAYAASGQPVAAYDAFAEYLARAPLDAERERAVRRAMRIAEGRIGRLWLQATPAEISIEIDGQLIGRASAGALRLKAGRHALVLRGGDLQTDVRSIDIEPGGDLRITAHLAPPPAPLRPGYVTLPCAVPDRLTPQLELAAERQEALARQRRTRLWSGLVGGAGLALVGTAVTLSVITASKRADWSKERDALNRVSLDDEGVSARLGENDREALVIQRLGDAAFATGLTGGVALALGTFLWLSADGSPRVQARVTSDGATLGYGGRF